jgi:hypothetical protein
MVFITRPRFSRAGPLMYQDMCDESHMREIRKLCEIPDSFQRRAFQMDGAGRPAARISPIGASFPFAAFDAKSSAQTGSAGTRRKTICLLRATASAGGHPAGSSSLYLKDVCRSQRASNRFAVARSHRSRVLPLPYHNPTTSVFPRVA